jgi:hypothetical protein
VARLLLLLPLLLLLWFPLLLMHLEGLLCLPWAPLLLLLPSAAVLLPPALECCRQSRPQSPQKGQADLHQSAPQERGVRNKGWQACGRRCAEIVQLWR